MNKKTHGLLTRSKHVACRSVPWLWQEEEFFWCSWRYFKHLLLFRICQIICHFCIRIGENSLWWMIIFVGMKKKKKALPIWERVRLRRSLPKWSVLKKRRFCFNIPEPRLRWRLLFSSPAVESVVSCFLYNGYAETNGIFVTWAQYFDTRQVL